LGEQIRLVMEAGKQPDAALAWAKAWLNAAAGLALCN